MRLPSLLHIGLLAALAAAACGGSSDSSSAGGSSSPTGPSPSGPATSGSCRLMASSATIVATALNFTANSDQTCSFNTGNNQATCTTRYSDSTGQSSTVTTIFNYASRADFVDEVQVIPIRNLALSTTSTTVGTAGTFTSSAQFSHDGQRRLTRIVGTSAAGTSTTTYTAWDGSGRPTAGTDVGPGFNNVVTAAYNDGARTRTMNFAGGVTTVETFDANGNAIRQVTSAGGTTSSTTVITPLTTQQICR